jgi:hypothetical protein
VGGVIPQQRPGLERVEDEVAVVWELDVPPFDTAVAVEAHLEPGRPDDSWVVIRPWLLRPVP